CTGGRTYGNYFDYW
nr:immunoglobulin heavy chain junction region [Mus musculus]